MAMMDISPADTWQLALAPLAGWPEAAQSRSVSKFGRLYMRYLAWRAQRETVRLLNAVDPATLRDLGITDIESQVYGAPEDRLRGYDSDWWRRQPASR